MLVRCPACVGRGYRQTAAGPRQPCPECSGSGRVTSQFAAAFELEPCPACKGDGRYASYARDQPCPCCLGYGDVPGSAAAPEETERAA